MTDRRDEHAAPEGFDHQRLKDFAVDVAAHPPRAVAAGKEQGVDVVEPGVGPGDRVPILRGVQHLRVCSAGIAVGAQESTDECHPAQSRHSRPDIEATPGDHDVVGGGRPAAFGGEHDDVPLPVRTCQLTATSVGSKSMSGIGIRTVAIPVSMPVHRLQLIEYRHPR